MPIFTQDAISIGQDGFTASTTQGQALGAIGRTRDGRMYRYVKAGAADLVAGNVVQAPAIVPNHLALTPVAAAVGATQVTVALGATLASAGQYAEGWLNVDTTPGNGELYAISGHPAAALSTNLTVTLRPEDSVQVALTTASRCGLLANPFNGVIQAPIVLTASVVGVAQYIIPANNFGWVQTRGPASVLINGTPALGAGVTNGATTAGSVDVITTTNLVTSVLVGYMMQVGVSTKNNLVFLRID